MSTQHRIPSQNIATLVERIAKIAKRAAKLGLTPVELTVGEQVQVPYVRPECLQGERRPTHEYSAADGDLASLEIQGRISYRNFTMVSVSGEPPTLVGWAFVATLTYVEVEGGARQVLLRSVPGAGELPKWVRESSPDTCHHCQASRRRRDTFVVRKVAQVADTGIVPASGAALAQRAMQVGECLQVGRNCLADFFPGKDPHKVAKQMEYLLSVSDAIAESGEGGGGGGYIEEAWPVREVVAVAHLMARTYGWVSRGQSREAAERGERAQATADKVVAYLDQPRRADDRRAWQEWRAECPITDADRAFSDSAVDWARELADQGDALNDYEHNLSVACSVAGITGRLMGVVASVVVAYQQAHRVIKQAVRSQHFGAVKQRLIMEVVVENTFGCNGQFGPTVGHKLVATGQAVGGVVPAGAVVKWFAQPSDAQQQGATVWVKGTIARQGEYRGELETTINRVEVMSADAALAEAQTLATKAARAAKRAAKVAVAV